MKKILMLAAAGMMVLASFGTSQAYTIKTPITDPNYGNPTYPFVYNPAVIGETFTGTWLGTVRKEQGEQLKDDADTVEAVLAMLGYTVEITSSAKVNGTSGSDGFEPGSSDLTTMTWDGGLSGTWQVSGGVPGVIDFYTVKSSTEFALYLVSPAASFGYWDTARVLSGGGTLPQISHFSGFNGGTSVPEPGTLLLLGSGLLGLGLMRRRKHSA